MISRKLFSITPLPYPRNCSLYAGQRCSRNYGRIGGSARWSPTNILLSVQKNRKHIIKGTVLLSLVSLTAYYWSDLTFIRRSLSRSGRTLLTVGAISLDYKRHFPLAEQQSELGLEEWTRARRACHQRGAARFLNLFQQNGGIYIKIGQHLSALEYILPEEYCRTMTILHSQAPTSSLEEVATVIREDLGREMMDLFKVFDPIPIGAASLAQVHRAILKEGQAEVAIKIQHLHLRSFMDMDMFVVSLAVKVVKRLFKDFDFDWLVDEMRINIPKELDFIQEAHNAERVARNFLQNGLLPVDYFSKPWWPWAAPYRVRVPRIHWEQTSQRILTMEYLPGAKVTDLAFMDHHGIDPRQVSTLITKIFSEMIFLQGFVHCDPHPGNLLVRLSRDAPPSRWPSFIWCRPPKWELVLLDHGLYREIPNEYRRTYAGLWKAVIDGNEDSLQHYCNLVGGGGAYRLFGCILAQRSWKSISSGTVAQPRSAEEQASIYAQAPNYLTKVTELLAQVPRPLLLLLKTNDLLRHLERSLTGRYGEPSKTFLIMAHYCIDALGEPDSANDADFTVARHAYHYDRPIWTWLAHLKIYFLETLVLLQALHVRLLKSLHPI